MEHALSDEAADALDKVLDYPAECPDDAKPIPPHIKLETNQKRLLNLKPKQKAIITELEGGRGFKQNLRTMNIREGKEITVITREPAGGPLVVKVDNTTVTIGRGMASKIILEDAR